MVLDKLLQVLIQLWVMIVVEGCFTHIIISNNLMENYGRLLLAKRLNKS